MESQSDETPLIVIVGETASGKTALAVQLAQRFNGEIIAADSRTVYKSLDIGTAKPTPAERRDIPHHLIDMVWPDQSFTAADFKQAANATISEIHHRGRLPCLVGGTGLYIDAVLYDFTFRPKTDIAEREKLNRLSVEELQNLLMDQGISLPENARNPRHLVGALETKGSLGERHSLRNNTLIIGLQLDRDVLRKRVHDRVNAMLDQGFLEECRRVSGIYGWNAPALQAPGYKAFRQYFEGNATLEEAKELFIRGDMQLAKRQRTWFKRDRSIQWIGKPEEAVDLVTTFLNK